MAPYDNRYGQYNDAVGRQSSQQPQGYSHQTSSVASYPNAATSSDYSSSVRQGYQPASTNDHQTYGSALQGTNANAPENYAAAALSSLSTQTYNASGLIDRTPSTSQYDPLAYSDPTLASNAYGATNMQMPNRSATTASPLYATNATSLSTYGLSATHGQNRRAQTTTPTFHSQSANSNSTYQTPTVTSASSNGRTGPLSTSYAQAAQNQPPRYNSPHEASRSAHSTNPSLTSTLQPSPHLMHNSTNARQSAFVEPAHTPATVDPSEVYDYRAEQQRKAQVEAERRRSVEEAEMVRKAEDGRLAAQKIAAEEARKFEEKTALKKADYARKAEAVRKAQEDRRQSKKTAAVHSPVASSGSTETAAAPGINGEPVPSKATEETEMREMFRKMREFHGKNPAMLSKLWEEERRNHSQVPQPPQSQHAEAVPSSTAQQPQQPAPVVSPPKDSPPTMRPFQKAKEPSSGSRASQEALKPVAVQAPAAMSAAPAVQPVNGSRQAASAQQVSIWPRNKQVAIAEAAAKYLLSQSANADKSITKDEIFAMLDKHPSYLELCESLKESGFVLGRAAFARELLSAEPLAMSNRSQPAQRQLSSQTIGAEVSTKSPGTQIEDGSLVQPRQSPFFAPLAQTNGSQPLEARLEVPPEPPRAPPANKEEAARKRTFHDLVDLTQGDSDDDDVLPPSKIIRGINAEVFNNVQSGRMPTGLMAGNTGQHTVPSPSFAGMNGHGSMPNDFRTTLDARDMFNQYKFKHQQSSPDGSHVPPAMPYSSRGSPPSFAALSASVEGQRRLAGMSPAAQRAPMLSRPPAQATAEDIQMQRINDQTLVEPIMRERVARKSKYDSRTIARDILLATGRHPDMEELNAHLNPMQGLLANYSRAYDLGGNHADLSTIRWDLIDPGKPEVDLIASRSVDTTGDADDEDDEPARPTAMQQVDNGDGTVSYAPVSHTMRGKGLIIRKKQHRGPGRPPKQSAPSKMQQLTGGPSEHTGGSGRQSIPSGQARVKVASRPAPNASTPGRTTTQPASTAVAGSQDAPSSAPPGGPNPVGYSAFKQETKYDENGNVIKRKGRPVGWRKAIHSRAAHGLPAAQSGMSGGSSSKKMDRPGKDRPKSPEPVYQEYKCEWEDCGSRLHNLATLKKHVVRIHAKQLNTGFFQCRWEGCYDGVYDQGKGKAKILGVHEFDNIEDWISHIESAHIMPVAFTLGDGPAGGIPDLHDSSDHYLSDAQGRSVTPIITPRSHNEEPGSRVTPAPPSGPASLSRLLMDGMSKDERDAAQELRKLEDRKRAIGPLLDRQGSRLANAKRRTGFLDDEDFEEEIESDDVP